MQPEVQDLLHVARVQRGHADVHQHRLRLAGKRRALAARVVTGHREHAAVLADAGVVGVLERVAAAVHTRRLAVPHAGDAVELLLAHGVQHLRAPHGGRGQVFVQAIDEVDVPGQQRLLVLDEGGIQHAHRRAAVAGDEHAGLQAAALVGTRLVERQSNQRVDAAHVDRAFFLGERRWGVASFPMTWLILCGVVTS